MFFIISFYDFNASRHETRFIAVFLTFSSLGKGHPYRRGLLRIPYLNSVKRNTTFLYFFSDPFSQDRQKVLTWNVYQI